MCASCRTSRKFANAFPPLSSQVSPPSAPEMKIAPADAYFAGHFPGQPILPGVTQIALAAEAIRREINATALCAVRHARLRQLVAPDEQLELTRRSVSGERV